MPVVLHAAAFRERCWVWPDLMGGRYRLGRRLLPSRKARIALQEGPGRFLGGTALFLTDIPRRTPYERKRPGGQVLYRVGRSWRVDSTPDDGALVVHVKGQGLVILTGCGHAGLINTVREAVRRTGVSTVWRWSAVFTSATLRRGASARPSATCAPLRRAG